MEPLSLRSDLDPSDPRPSRQTHLRVFKPPADLLPGGCNWELVAFEDKADHQPGPSNLEQTAMQDPDDTGSSGLKPSAPQGQADTRMIPSVFKTMGCKEVAGFQQDLDQTALEEQDQRPRASNLKNPDDSRPASEYTFIMFWFILIPF